MPEIKVSHLVKRFGNVLAVDNLSFSINKGEIFGLVGPNCAGKSTTIKMITGLLKPDRGEILIKEKDAKYNPQEIKKIIGLVPQDIAIFESISAGENVNFFGSLYGLRGRVLKELAKEALDFAGLYDKRHDKPKGFSGGMKRRLNIACSMVHRPEILVMDEPTVGIDAQSRNHILESVKEISRNGTTVIYTSHYMEEVESVCDRIGIIDFGKMIAQGDKNELKMLSNAEEIIKIELENGSGVDSDEIRRLSGVLETIVCENTLQISSHNAHSVLQNIIEILIRTGVKINSINLSTPSLENVFLTLTGRRLRD